MTYQAHISSLEKNVTLLETEFGTSTLPGKACFQSMILLGFTVRW